MRLALRFPLCTVCTRYALFGVLSDLRRDAVSAPELVGQPEATVP